MSISPALTRKLLKEGKLESFVVNDRGDRRVPITALQKFMRINSNQGLGMSPVKANEARRRKVRRVKNLFEGVKDTEKDGKSDNEKLR